METTRVRVDVPHTRVAPARPEAVPQAAGPAPSRASRRWSRLIRWAVGAAMLAEAAWLVTPAVLFRTSVRATITAPLVAIRVDRAGVVRGAPPPVGTAVAAGQPLFEVETTAPDRRPSEALRAEIGSIRRTADALRAQIAELDRLQSELARHFDAYREARVAQAEGLAAEQSARVGAAAARLDRAEDEYRRDLRLASRGVAAAAELARAERAVAEARAELEAARLAEARYRHQIEAARRGLFVGEADGGQDRVASRQRRDEIAIQQAGLRARLGELDGRLDELESRLASEERHLAAGRLTVVAPIGGVVWSSALAPGSPVSPGATALEIVDPSRPGVEAFFQEADAPRIRPGAPVKARLHGSSRVLHGRVIRAGEPGEVEQATIVGAARAPSPPGLLRALIRLDDRPAGGAPDHGDSIGEPAVVWTAR